MKAICIVVLVVMTTIAARAEVRIEHMTWLEVRAAIDGGKTTIIVPTGGTEQNGPHMVLGKHNFIVAETSRRIAERLGDALVAPVLAYVPEGAIGTGHMAYPGTISVPEQVFASVLQATAESFKAHGFTTIAFIGDSGGNQSAQREVAARLTEQWQSSTSTSVIVIDGYYAANGGRAWLESQGETAATIGSHAGIQDTSELMAVLPSGVDLSKADPEGGNGATGDATRASAKRGAHLLELKITAALKQIRAAQKTR